MSLRDSLSYVMQKNSSEKSSNLAGEEGMIHPIYEATAALLKNQLTDQEARKRLLDSKDADSIKSVLTIDYLLGTLKDNSCKTKLRSMFNSGRSLTNLIEYASLCLSEDKRIENGNVLYNLQTISKETKKNLVREIKKKNLSRDLYVRKDYVNSLERKAVSFRNRRNFKKFLVGVLICSFITGGCYMFNNYELKRINKTENVRSKG
ncbi:MAG: hypothetical protein ABIB79_05200 [archaeon]